LGLPYNLTVIRYATYWPDFDDWMMSLSNINRGTTESLKRFLAKLTSCGVLDPL